MTMLNRKLVIAAAIVGPMVSSTVTLGQVVMAQNMTEYMTSPNGNTTGTETLQFWH
jgi:hypothetical protein